MLSAEDNAALKISIVLCTNPELKQKILSLNEREYLRSGKTSFSCKYRWMKIIWEKAAEDIASLSITKDLEEKILGMIHVISLRMINWVAYHESVLGLPREYFTSFMRSSFFTSNGIIDCRKASEELMKETSLRIDQKFKIASLYQFSDIDALYYQLLEEDLMETIWKNLGSQNIRQPRLHGIWYVALGMEGTVKKRFLNKFLLKGSIASGSLPAVAFCLDKKIYDSNKTLVYYALEAVKNWVITTDNRFIFGEDAYNIESEWFPSECYADILCLLFANMDIKQKITFLKEDIKKTYEEGEVKMRSNIF